MVVKRSNKVCQALNLPKVLNLNPRSIYNKINEFVTFVDEENIDLACLSESWERENLTLENVINIENFKVISNVSQRSGSGGRPAIIVNTQKYQVENLTQSIVSIPWGVEAVWAVLTPKNVSNDSKIQKIVVGSIYSKPDSRKKTLLLDHITQVYSQMNTKYKKGLHWLICGDTNELKLDPILQLNPNMKQVVQNPTRLDPPRILDPIITTLSDFYQLPECLEPLDADPESNGKPSDHLMVVMEPISQINNKPGRTKKSFTFRPFTEDRLQKMHEWIEQESWVKVAHETSAHLKMEMFQNILVKKYQECFPEKTRTVSSDDQPFYTQKLENLKRRKSREFHKRRKSNRWIQMNVDYEAELSKAKKNHYRKKVKGLRKVQSKYWYRELKKLTSFDQLKSEEIIVESIKELSDEEQAELIADNFAAISQEYEKLKTEDIKVPYYSESDIPVVTEEDVINALESMDANKSNVNNDVPLRILKKFAKYIAKPFAEALNASIRQGCWPDILKLEIVTPVPKVYPPKQIDELRNISGLLNLDKIAEKIISKMMIKDMKKQIDPSQYANQEGLSINHYLVKVIDKILKTVDRNSKKECVAVLATLVDWKQAFPRQCPKLGIESFVKNGVRPALIPMLINYFQGRNMKVKWRGRLSSKRELKGGGPQGSTFGLWEYLSQSNDNANSVDESERYKFVDDLTFLEIIHLLNVGLATYNVRQHVPSDLPTHNQIVTADNLKSQNHLKVINEWTKKKKMKLNIKKTKNMIFNFTKKFQFTTKLSVDSEPIEMVNQTKLLGTYLTEDLKWDKNTSEIVKSAWQRMQLLFRSASFTSNRIDLKNIYLTFVRSILEKSAVVWHSSLTKKNRLALERVQKAAIKVIMGKSYTNYKEGLAALRIDNLDKRRQKLCLKFAKKCLNNDKVRGLFPKEVKKHTMKVRKTKKYKKCFARTERYKKSTIPYMVDLLNNEDEEKKQMMK